MSFESLDGNADGTISLEEFTTNAPSGRRRSSEDIFNRLLKEPSMAVMVVPTFHQWLARVHFHR